MTTTIALSADWDLYLDPAGNIATVTGPAQIEQDVATACRTMAGECVYDTTLGVPYLTQILGKIPNPSLFKAAQVQAAQTVPGVVSAVCYITQYTPQLQGQVQVTDSTGAVAAVSV